jgi:hypothetical protein
MRVLVACEFSGVVRRAFRERGHHAYSCDLIPSTDNSPYHIQGDVLSVMRGVWDLMIAHPPCTFLAVSGARWWGNKAAEQDAAIYFFERLVGAPIPRIAVENPIGVMSTKYRKPDQIVQPWMFGHGEVKATCLWMKNLPQLEPTDLVAGREPRVHYESPGIKGGLTRQQRRSVTLAGIAEAMANQWGIPIPVQEVAA